MATPKSSIQWRLPDSVIDKGLEESLPIGVQKSYFMLTETERSLLNLALEKYRPGQTEPILVGGQKALKPALRLAGNYRLAIEEIKGSQPITSYTRWVDSVQVHAGESQEIYLTFSPHFEHIWLELKKHLPRYLSERPAKLRLRSQYSVRLYNWAKRYATVGSKRISLDRLRKVLGLESIKDADGNVIQEAPLPIWANLRQRALDTAIAEINKKTDLSISLEELGRSSHRRITTLTFDIKIRPLRNGDRDRK
jgi:Initiator Rep protein, WH2/Initiator Replication protein, WH1